MVVVALLSVDLVESVDLVSVVLVVNCTLGFPLIRAVLRPSHGSLPIDPLIDFSKGFSSKMTLEVAARGLTVFFSYTEGQEG